MKPWAAQALAVFCLAIACSGDAERTAPLPLDESDLRAIVRSLEADRDFQTECATTQVYLGAQINAYGEPGWEFVEREIDDPEHARWLKDLIKRSGG